jgi:NADPH-dependent 2,4-dienoyl-CoA reductase/sulfur reductase-like enzyme/rhodanese-related sulfurtransferase
MSKRVLIIGGVAGGASAAARLRRLDEDAGIIVFERGAFISFANCGLPYHIGGQISERKRLLIQTPESMKARFNIDVRVFSEVISIDREKKRLKIKDLQADTEYYEAYDALVLSPGAEPSRPPIKGIDHPRVKTLRSIPDMDAIKSLVEDESTGPAVVIGGGFIGLEMAEALRETGRETILVELLDQVMAPADPEMASLLHKELRMHGVDLRLGVSVTEFKDKSGQLQLVLSDGRLLDCGMAVLAIGVRPETKLAKDAGLELGQTGGIAVNASMCTNDPDIYAVGDAVEIEHFVSSAKGLVPLAGPANRQARIAADNICGRTSEYKRTQGTAICKVFEQAFGMTGLSEKAARKEGLAFEKVYVHPASHAGYYPGASPVSLKLLFNPENGKILGAQAVGKDGVDKRIDVLAMAIRSGLSVYELEEAELSYAPPFGSAKDVINYAGFVAANALRGDVSLCHVEDMKSVSPHQLPLDVRTQAEVAAGTIDSAKHIPLDDLRSHLSELDKGKEYLVFCQVGLRGYLACRILTQKGFRCRNLSGGYKTYSMAMAAGA